MTTNETAGPGVQASSRTVATALAAKTNAPTGQQEQAQHLSDNNPRWKGYSYLAFTSLVCCASAGNVKQKTSAFVVSVAVGSVSFGLSMLVLLLDRFQGCFDSFNFHRAYDGKLEGFFLLFLVAWWIFGVWIMTQSGGAAYYALNVYFSSWLSLCASFYTLNDWSGSKDILTIQELTALSKTLRGWYCLLFSSLVVLGSGADMHIQLSEYGPKQEASFAVSLGLISMIVATIIILAHYRILSFVPISGFVELSIAGVMMILWIFGYVLRLVVSPFLVCWYTCGLFTLPIRLEVLES